jgi:enamine deaminase RidA (YjgF/YER057c/UK114 family)
VYISGQVAFDASGALVGKDDFIAQTRQVMENLKAALAAAGATFENVVKVNTYVTDLSQIQALREIRASYFGPNPPASTLVQIVALATPDLMIEVEAIAVLAV